MKKRFVVEVEYPEETNAKPIDALKSQIKHGSPERPVFVSKVMHECDPHPHSPVEKLRQEFTTLKKQVENCILIMTGKIEVADPVENEKLLSDIIKRQECLILYSSDSDDIRAASEIKELKKKAGFNVDGDLRDSINIMKRAININNEPKEFDRPDWCHTPQDKCSHNEPICHKFHSGGCPYYKWTE